MSLKIKLTCNSEQRNIFQLRAYVISVIITVIILNVSPLFHNNFNNPLKNLMFPREWY